MAPKLESSSLLRRPKGVESLISCLREALAVVLHAKDEWRCFSVLGWQSSLYDIHGDKTCDL